MTFGQIVLGGYVFVVFAVIGFIRGAARLARRDALAFDHRMREAHIKGDEKYGRVN
jgi:hypothetical protein